MTIAMSIFSDKETPADLLSVGEIEAMRTARVLISSERTSKCVSRCHAECHGASVETSTAGINGNREATGGSYHVTRDAGATSDGSQSRLLLIYSAWSSTCLYLFAAPGLRDAIFGSR